MSCYGNWGQLSYAPAIDAVNTILKDAVPKLDSFSFIETTAKTHVVAEAVGNKAMAVFIKQRE